jgi:type VI secretion system ImpC/EvpB family protein/type VI secretion system ImpB/VipA family protein
MSEEPIPPELEVDFPMPDGLRVTTDRPYRILLLADLAGSADGRLSGPLTDRVVEVTPDTFDELLSGARPSVSFKTTDPVAAGNVMVEVALDFDSLKAFQPAAVAQQLPATRALMRVREQVVARLRGKLSASQLADSVRRAASADPQLAWLPEVIHWTPSAAPPAEDAVEGLLGQLDLGDQSARAPKSPIGAVVSAAAARGGVQIPAEEASALRRALAQLDQRVTTWLDAVFHAPPVQRLEAGWRTLAFLVSHLDFRKGLRLSVLHAARQELTSRLVSLVIDPVFDQGAEAPDLILVDACFGNSAPDVETLDELAQHAASLPAVVLAGLSAEFFGVKHAWQVPSLPPLMSLVDQWQFAKWNTLRGQPHARALGVVFGRGLLRPAYEKSTADPLDFAYREECLADKDLVWASGPIAAGCTIARSMADTGWPTGMVGRLEGFATCLGGKKGDKRFGPADIQMPLEKAQEMATVGLNVVIALKEETRVVVCNGFSVARPSRAEGYALLEVSLPYQLFAARLSSLLLDLKPHLTGLAQDKLVAFTLAHVRDWLTVEDVTPDEQQVAVQARPLEDDPNSLQLVVTVTPPPRILPGSVPVVVGYRVR